jgi:hypothetical protein
MDEENVLGTENIKVVFSFAFGIAEDVIAAKADGKINLADGPRFVDDLFRLPGLINAVPQVDDEYLDMTEAEAEEIKVFVREKLKLPAANVEEVVEAGFDVVMDASKMVQSILVMVEKIKALKA